MRLGAMAHLGMISYQGSAGACDGRAQVTLGYRSGGQSDWGQADYIRTKWDEVGLTALSSSPTTNMDLLCKTRIIYKLHVYSTRTAYNNNEPRLGSPKIFKYIYIYIKSLNVFFLTIYTLLLDYYFISHTQHVDLLTKGQLP